MQAVIRDVVTQEKQGWTREVTRKIGQHKVRATVYRDSYDFQSRIKVEVFSMPELKWNTVQTLSGTEYSKDLPGPYNVDTLKATAASQTLVDILFGYAEEILL